MSTFLLLIALGFCGTVSSFNSTIEELTEREILYYKTSCWKTNVRTTGKVLAQTTYKYQRGGPRTVSNDVKRGHCINFCVRTHGCKAAVYTPMTWGNPTCYAIGDGFNDDRDNIYFMCTTFEAKAWSVALRTCFDTNFQDLKCIHGRGVDYTGTQAITPSGKTCQKWTSQYPNKHGMVHKYPNTGLVGNNFCRNPDDGAFGPWCYNSAGTNPRWEYCGIYQCNADCLPITEVFLGLPGEYHAGSDDASVWLEIHQGNRKCTTLKPTWYDPDNKDWKIAEILYRNLFDEVQGSCSKMCFNKKQDIKVWVYMDTPSIWFQNDMYVFQIGVRVGLERTPHIWQKYNHPGYVKIDDDENNGPYVLRRINVEV